MALAAATDLSPGLTIGSKDQRRCRIQGVHLFAPADPGAALGLNRREADAGSRRKCYPRGRGRATRKGRPCALTGAPDFSMVVSS